MNKLGLIGYNGLVGGAISSQTDYNYGFNSRNIQNLEAEEFELLICAAAPGSMMLANRNPKMDRKKINTLIASLSRARTKRIVLISSIAVLDKFGVGDDEATKRFQKNHPYGEHRRLLEEFCENNFLNSTIIRLPSLFGGILKKNFIFDLLNPVPTMLSETKIKIALSNLDLEMRDLLFKIYKPEEDEFFILDRASLNIHPLKRKLERAMIEAEISSLQFHNRDSIHQFYNLNRIWRDIKISIEADLKHIHLATEPIKCSDIFHELTNNEMPNTQAKLHKENMKTLYSELFNCSNGYVESRENILSKLKDYYFKERAK
jgi:hypothetical protein